MLQFWHVAVAAAVAFFVTGQALLRSSSLDGVATAHVFIISMGAVAAVALLVARSAGALASLGRSREGMGLDMSGVSKLTARAAAPAILAGATFYAGNVLWVQAIKASPNVALVRTLMAGLEIAAVAFFLFGQRVTGAQAALIALGMACLVAASLLAPEQA